MEPRIEPLFTTREVVVASVRGLVVIDWRGTPSAPLIEGFAPRLEALVRSRPEGVAILTAAGGMPRPPGDATRRLAARWIQRIAPGLRAAAFLIDDEGFRAAAGRAVVTGLLALVRPTQPTRVFATLDLAAAWLLPYAVRDGEPVFDLRAAVTRVRALSAPAPEVQQTQGSLS